MGKTFKSKLIILVAIVLCFQLIACKTLPKHPTLVNSELPNLIQTRDFFFNQDDKFGFRVSPDGKKIAWFEAQARRLFIAFRHIGDDKKKLIQLDPKGRRTSLYWSRDSRHIYFHEDNDSDENYRIFYVDIDHPNQAATNITHLENTRALLVETMVSDPENIIVMHNNRDKSVSDLFKINIKTRKQILIAENPGDVQNWLVDEEGTLRGRVRKNSQDREILEVLSGRSKEWRECLSWEEGSVKLLDFDKDKTGFWLLSDLNKDKMALTHLDISTGEETLIYEEPLVDIDKVILSEKSKEPLLILSNPDYPKIYYFQSKLEEKFRIFFQEDKAGLTITSKDHNEQWFTIEAYTDKGTHYYLFNLDTGERELLGKKTITKYAESLSRMKPISFESRDGLTLHGYLTIPNGTQGKNLPMILFVHGGPWSRDRWGYDSMTQLLANRGYAILQVNFGVLEVMGRNS